MVHIAYNIVMEHDCNRICNDPIHNPEPGPIFYAKRRFNESIPLLLPFEFPQYLNVLWQGREERLQERVDHFFAVNNVAAETDDDRLSSI